MTFTNGSFMFGHSGRYYACYPPASSLTNLPRFGHRKTSEDPQRQQQYLNEIRRLSPEGQMALRELFQLATAKEGHLGHHAYYARILGGKYPEIRKLIIEQSLSIVIAMRAPEEEAQAATAQREDFEAAMAILCEEPAPHAPGYVPVKQIPKADADRYGDCYNAVEEQRLAPIKRQYPRVRRPMGKNGRGGQLD